MSEGRVLICAPLMPEYDREGGGAVIWDLIMFLREAGWAVSFASENPNVGDRYARMLRQRGVAVYRGFGPRLDVLIAAGQFDLAVFAFWYIGERMIPRVRKLSPSTRIAVHTIDLHFLRHARTRFSNNGSEAPLDLEYATETARELNVYGSADVVFTMSRKEADLVNDLTGDVDLARVVTDSGEMPASRVGFKDRRGLLFVGNFRHPPNVEAVEYLCREVIPRLAPRTLVEHPLRVVGNGLTDGVAGFARGLENVHMVGWVPSVLPYLHRARVAVVPLLHGAGTKRKVLEAMGAGTPLVSTSVGLEGLDVRPGAHALQADDPQDFANSTDRLLRDAPLWHRLAKNGRKHVEGAFSRAEVGAGFLDTVEQVRTRTPKYREVPDESIDVDPMLVKPAYRDLLQRLKQLVQGAVPEHATVVVASRGDPELTDIEGRRGWHFPRDRRGVYSGSHPADSGSAIQHLEDLRAAGADFFVLPSTAFWWLNHYKDFADHLHRHYEVVLRQEDTCVVYRLS